MPEALGKFWNPSLIPSNYKSGIRSNVSKQLVFKLFQNLFIIYMSSQHFFNDEENQPQQEM
jgi:hypothetical protein